MSSLALSTRRATLAMAISSFILMISSSPRERICCNGFFLPPPPKTRHRSNIRNLLPTSLEDWDNSDVEDWLRDVGFDRYSQGFASDFGGIGVDGDRLIYLGTEDQLDHIEYQLSLIGVNDESDQRVLGSTIIELVAASELTPELLESLVEMVPVKNRDKECNDEDKDEVDGNLGFPYNPPDFEI